MTIDLEVLTSALDAREQAMGDMTVKQRIEASLSELSPDDAKRLAVAMADVALTESGGVIPLAVLYGIMGGLEVGRELERRL